MARWGDETNGSCRTSWDLAPGSDRTAGDSSPVTQENGRLRGRPGPAGGNRPAQGLPSYIRMLTGPAAPPPPAPLRGTDAGAGRERASRLQPARPFSHVWRRTHKNSVSPGTTIHSPH
ncbi:hypothetical protein SHO565_01520 [Streptomyces sp. HO565]